MRTRIVRLIGRVARRAWAAMNVPLFPKLTCRHSWKIVRVEDCGESYCHTVTAKCRRCGCSAQWKAQ